MDNALAVQQRERLILGSSDWFYMVRHYEYDLPRIGMSLKSVLSTTLDITCRAVAGGRTLYAVPSGPEYHNLLTQYLLQIDAKWHESTNPEIIAVAAEVSTFFYNEMTDLFRYWGLTDFQVATMNIEGWIADDLIVTIVY